MVKLRNHQLKAIHELESGKILAGDTGTGKTLTALGYFVERETMGLTIHKDLYVITTARKRDSLDWVEEASHFRLFREREASENKVQLVVDSWQNIEKYVDVKGAFFIFDEQRLVGSGKWVKSFLKIAKANRWILLSATPGDTWMDYIPVFVANGFYRNKTDFIDQHVIYKPYRNFPVVSHYVGTKRLERLRSSLIVEMPVARTTIKHRKTIFVDYDQAKLKDVIKRRWNIYEDKPIENSSELFSVMKRVTNSDERRVDALRALVEKHPRSIVFYNFDYELDILRRACSDNGWVMAEWNGHKHEPLPEGDAWVYLAQYTAASEAWNCITTNAMVFWSLNYSYKVMHQSEGRIDRLNTPHVNLYYYILRCGAPLDTAIVQALRGKKTFSESAFKVD